MADLVLAMAGGYQAAALRPFLNSLRRTGFAGEVKLLLHRNPPGTALTLRAGGATPVEVQPPGVPEIWSYNVARYALFERELAGLAAADRVLLADCRDVIFQGQPFAAFADDAVHLFEEHPSKPIGGCIWTSSWLRYRYGDAALPKVAMRPVLCSGLVIGRASRVAHYLRLVAAELTPSLPATHYMAGYDQGVVNNLAYSGRIPALVAHGWANARVLHLGNVPAGEVRIDARGQVLNAAGEVALAVHQYDRHPQLSGLGRQ